jgi:hypothetical protein
METSEILGRGWLLVCGLVAAVHFFLMANASTVGPVWLKYLIYPATATLGGASALFAAMPGAAALTLALWCASAALGGALVVYLSVWAAGGRVCDVFRLHHIHVAHAAMNRHIAPQVHAGKVAAEYLTPSTFDALHDLEDRR